MMGRTAKIGATLALAAGAVVGVLGGVSSRAASPKGIHVVAATPQAAGRYLVVIGGCNDCHTPGYAERGGQVPEAEWLTGSPVGFRGPWGTTYPVNLRLFVQKTSEDGWVQMARTVEGRPPMPWFNLRALSDQDLRAMYRFIKQLGPQGAETPAYVPPDQAPKTPAILFVPQPPK
jgi:mono/diheme cytochrome c family protein